MKPTELPTHVRHKLNKMKDRAAAMAELKRLREERKRKEAELEDARRQAAAAKAASESNSELQAQQTDFLSGATIADPDGVDIRMNEDVVEENLDMFVGSSGESSQSKPQRRQPQASPPPKAAAADSFNILEGIGEEVLKDAAADVGLGGLNHFD